jgi:hypothetical protein
LLAFIIRVLRLLDPEDEGTVSFETSGALTARTHRGTQEDLRQQQNRCDNNESHRSIVPSSLNIGILRCHRKFQISLEIPRVIGNSGAVFVRCYRRLCFVACRGLHRVCSSRHDKLFSRNTALVVN